jgi:hypothetical protein
MGDLMALDTPGPGLRPVHNRSKQPAKVMVHIAANDTLFVSDDVRDQLQAATTAIADGAAPVTEPEAAPAPRARKRAS